VKRALVILLGALLLMLAIAAGTVAFLAATDRGTRFLADQAERFLPLELDDVSGALLGEIRVGELTYRLEGQTLRITELNVAVQAMPLLFDNQLVVDRLSAALVALQGSGAPAADSGPPPALELPFLPLTIDVASFEVDRLDIEPVFPMALRGSAAWLADGLVIRALEITSEVVDLAVEGELGTGANPPLSAQVSWSVPATEWGGQGSLEGRVNEFDLQHTLRGFVSGDARGIGSLAVLTEPSVDLQVALDDLVFGDTAVRDIDGRLEGTLANLTADAAAEVTAPGIEPFAVEVAAYGPVNGPLTIGNVTAAAAGGTQQAQGSVAWAEAVRVSLGGYLRDVVLGRLHPAVEGTLDSAFQLLYQDEALAITLTDMSGTFADRPIDGEVHLAQVPDGWALEPLRLQVGDNRLSGTGHLAGDTMSLDATIDAANLDALDLGVAGDLRGDVRLRGTWSQLDGSAQLESGRLSGFGAELSNARVTASLSDGVLDGALDAARAGTETLVLQETRLTAVGPLDELDWGLAWSAGSASGALLRRDGAVLARLDEFRFQALERTWDLQDVTRVRLEAGRLELAGACIAGGEAAACVETFSFADGRIETRGELQRAPVGLLQPWLPVRLAEAGYVEGSWSLTGEPTDPRGELTLAARRLAFVPATEDDAVNLPDIEASGQVGDGALTMRLAATDQAFRVVGDVALEPLRADGNLSGALEVAVADLSPVRVLDQRLETVSGRIDGRLELSGSPAAPRAEGRFQLADGVVALNNPDLRLTAVNAQLRIDDGGTFELDGSARQREDEVRLAASGSGLFGGLLTARATLVGENLQARHPDWEITVSPDLEFNYTGGSGQLRGRVEVPEAQVRLNTLPQSVPSPSEDVVVVGRDRDSEVDAQQLRVNVDVVLGEDVTLKALGITAELQGSLRARLDAQGRTTLRGTLDVTGGVLSAQGQTLAIESGTVVYNGPVSRPYIDIRAVRIIDDVTPEVKVGLHIRGDADNLTSSVFSEPPMAEARALGFLILGRDIEQESSEGDGGQLMAAAINLGLSRAKGLTSELMRMTGLDELSASAEAQDSFDIIAGKRVTDDLYVRYTYNTLSALGTFLVRYELSDRWSLEAQSGEQSAMDLMYSVEK
jgi:translocation and assembly module TamB